LCVEDIVLRFLVPLKMGWEPLKGNDVG